MFLRYIFFHFCMNNVLLVLSLMLTKEKRINLHNFQNRSLLELALTHPSYRTNYGTNSDHARNTLNNCGVRSSKQRIHDRLVQQQLSAKKRGTYTQYPQKYHSILYDIDNLTSRIVGTLRRE